jgi:molecular chaperone GrpE
MADQADARKDQEQVSEESTTSESIDDASTTSPGEPIGAEDDGGSPADGTDSSTDELEALRAEVAELKDQLLRKTADFENYRKRMLREKEELGTFANRELLTDIVPIIDDFERAIRSSEESQDFTAFHNGIVLIEKQFVSMLERKWRLVRFDSAGEEFDPQRHEAMMTEESAEVEQPTVTEDFQKGYLLDERVLRPAKVKVAMPAASTEDSSNE